MSVEVLAGVGWWVSWGTHRHEIQLPLSQQMHCWKDGNALLVECLPRSFCVGSSVHHT